MVKTVVVNKRMHNRNKYRNIRTYIYIIGIEKYNSLIFFFFVSIKTQFNLIQKYVKTFNIR